MCFFSSLRLSSSVKRSLHLIKKYFIQKYWITIYWYTWYSDTKWIGKQAWSLGLYKFLSIMELFALLSMIHTFGHFFLWSSLQLSFEFRVTKLVRGQMVVNLPKCLLNFFCYYFDNLNPKLDRLSSQHKFINLNHIEMNMYTYFWTRSINVCMQSQLMWDM